MFLKSRNEPLIGWELWAVPVFFEQRRTELLEQYDERVAKQKRLEQKREAKPVEKPHFDNFTTALRKFLWVTGLTNLTASDLTMLDVDAKDWGTIYQRKRKQAGETPASALEARWNIASDSQSDVEERIFAWPFRLSAEAGIRWVIF